MVLWIGSWRFPYFSCLFRFWFRFRVLLLIILFLIFSKVSVVLKVVPGDVGIGYRVLAAILSSGAMLRPQEDRESKEEGHLPKASHRPD